MDVVQDGQMPPKLRGYVSSLGVRCEGKRSQRCFPDICPGQLKEWGCPLPLAERTWGAWRMGSGASFELLSLSCLLYMLMVMYSSLLF